MSSHPHLPRTSWCACNACSYHSCCYYYRGEAPGQLLLFPLEWYLQFSKVLAFASSDLNISIVYMALYIAENKNFCLFCMWNFMGTFMISFKLHSTNLTFVIVVLAFPFVVSVFPFLLIMHMVAPSLHSLIRCENGLPTPNSQ